MDENNLRPGYVNELFHLSNQYPDSYQGLHVIALGSAVNWGAGSWSVPFMSYKDDGSYRSLDCTTIDHPFKADRVIYLAYER